MFQNNDPVIMAIPSDFPGKRKEKMECLKWLVQMGILDLKTLKNLHLSSTTWIQNTYPEFLEYAIDNGCLQFNEKLLSDYYPIHLVSMHHINNISLLQILIDKGADVNQKAGPNGLGGTALHFALLDLETVKILLANGAAVNALDEMGRTPLYCYLHTNTNCYKDPEIKRLLIEHGAIEKR